MPPGFSQHCLSDLVMERHAPGPQPSPVASPSRTILPEEDHADELDPPDAAQARRLTDHAVDSSSQPAAVPASRSGVIGQPAPG
jgi:hypothetical protein